MGLRPSLPDVRSPSRGAPRLGPSIQLAPAPRQPKIKTAHQSPRSDPGQPVEAPHLEKAGQLDILHANAGTYVGGDLVDADTGAIDRMLNLNVNVVMKNVHDVLPHMIERRTGDIIVTSSLAAHFPTPWEPGLCVVQVGDQLLCPDGATPSLQARHSRGLNLARHRRQRTARGLAACAV